jgi:hypothetical protein
MAFTDAEVLYIWPRQGEFDVDSIGKFIDRLGYSFRDPLVPDVFLVTEAEEAREFALRYRREQPEKGFPYVLKIKVTPGKVTIHQLASPEEVELSRQFVVWLLAQYPCRVEDDYGTDLTQSLR